MKNVFAAVSVSGARNTVSTSAFVASEISLWRGTAFECCSHLLPLRKFHSKIDVLPSGLEFLGIVLAHQRVLISTESKG